MRRLLLRVARKLVWSLDRALSEKPSGPRTITNGREREIVRCLDAIVLPDADAEQYFAKHRQRITRTLTLLPEVAAANANTSLLELGSYGQMAAVAHRVLGYTSVRGAYYSPELGHTEKSVAFRDGEPFPFPVDLFDVERHAFPYPDESFDAILCCELIEHLLHDPMWMLFEANRVLRHNGVLLLTTPNIASLISVARVLNGAENPQIFSQYSAPGDNATPHVREYTPAETATMLDSAGFRTESLFTEANATPESYKWVERLLSANNFPTDMRGEQMYCVARKEKGPGTRFPGFLYANAS